MKPIMIIVMIIISEFNCEILASKIKEAATICKKDPYIFFLWCTKQLAVEWFTASCLLHAARTVVGSSPEPPLMLADTSAGTWIKKTRLPY